ncbi:SDR family oxidoreductase [Enterococcus sp. 669A]|uniref:SDR family oxidoreductase n=1 Tax=Candidatus Enterococcus moelleringii TaxID=2815325 RepID=A0ABS3L8P4_9ENTE|nr:SDR family oxidoreductase [Enterococcus sp. 669A]MBO1305991.1 SDR family oxidoreductase [Enterococcus sp. 669A]
MTYLVTGATGELGGKVLNHLKELVPMEEIFALARSEEKAAPLKEAGFQIRIGDYSDSDALEKALAGIDRLLLVSGAPGNRQAEHENVVNAAKKSGVSFLAYTSLANAVESTSSLADDHVYTEKVIAASGIPHTFLRNNWYLENEVPLLQTALANGKFVYAAGNGKTGWALRREYAEAAAKVLVGADFPEILELSGTPITYEELGQALQKVTDKEIEIISADDQGFVENMTAGGLPKEVAEVFLGFQKDIGNDVLDVASDDFEKVLGHPLSSREEAVKELIG